MSYLLFNGVYDFEIPSRKNPKATPYSVPSFQRSAIVSSPSSRRGSLVGRRRSEKTRHLDWPCRKNLNPGGISL